MFIDKEQRRKINSKILMVTMIIALVRIIVTLIGSLWAFPDKLDTLELAFPDKLDTLELAILVNSSLY